MLQVSRKNALETIYEYLSSDNLESLARVFCQSAQMYDYAIEAVKASIVEDQVEAARVEAARVEAVPAEPAAAEGA
jgi:hypothetical protein